MSEKDKKPVWEDLDYKHDAIVEASAGTGKTYALEHIVAHLVNKKGVDVRNLLLVTFTEKAAGELKERIRKMLDGTAAAKQLDEATICTIQSVCQDLLREYPFESGMQMASDVVSSDRVLFERSVQSVMTGSKFRQKYGETFSEEMSKWDPKKGSKELNSAACERVGAIAQSGLDAKLWWEKHIIELFAGYRILINQVLADIRKITAGKDPGRYILEEYTFATKSKATNEKKLNELDKQLKELREYLGKGKWDMCFITDTISSLFARIGSLGDGIALCDKENKKIIQLDEDGNPKIDKNGKEVAETLGHKYPQYKKLKDLVKEVLKKSTFSIMDDIGELAYDEYCRMKKRSRTMTFDDMVLEASRAVKDAVADKDNPAKQAFLKNIRSRYRIALVDEFQDTDDKQWTIFNSLFSSKVNRIEGANPAQGCLIVVGDPKQAIYSFRGADIGTYLTARKEIKTNGGQELPLDKMYRSTHEMVDAYNKIFDKPKDQDDKPIEGAVGWFDNMQANGEPIEYKKVYFPKEKPPEDVKDFEYPEADPAVELLESLPESGAADKKARLALYLENMAEEMIRLHKDEFWKGKMSWSSMCVLVRSHANGQAAQEVLRAKGIPCRIYKEAGLFDSAEAESVLALFDYLTMPRRAGNLAALLLTPFFEVPLSGIEKRLTVGGVAFDRLCDRWRTYIAKCEWVKFFESAMNDTELGNPHFVMAEGKSRIDGDFQCHRSAIRQIFDLLLVQCGRSRDLTAFSDALRTWARDDAALGEAGSVRNKESEADAVQIMTMHAAKGLEFNAVFVAYGFSSVNMPDTPKEERPAEEMELRRLLYVALTRAKYKLYLPWSKRASGLDSWGTEKYPTALSTFLGRSILTLCGDAGKTKAKVKGVDQLPEKRDKGKGVKYPLVADDCPDLPPRLGMKGWRFKWDSFSSLYHHAAPKTEEVEGAKVTNDELQGNDDSGNDGKHNEENGGEKQESLVPKGALSGTVFHEVMETLCGNDEDKDEVGFKIGEENDFENLIKETEEKKSPLLEIVRRKLAANGVANRPGKNPGESTAVSIARMAWNALRTRLDFGGGNTFKLCMVPLKDRKAEVNFVLDESKLGNAREEGTGALNGSIDLLIKRDDGYYIIDWKTNALEDYKKETVEVAMNNAGYHDQYKIYTLAAEKWLGGEVVKGAAYLFVRGGEFGNSPSGVYVHPMKDGERSEFTAGLVKRIGDSDKADEEREAEER